jgi:hypothetical protein
MWLSKFQEAYQKSLYDQQKVIEGSRGLKKDLRRKQAFAKKLSKTDSLVDYKNNPKKAAKSHSDAFHAAQKMNYSKDSDFEYKDAAEKLHDWGTPENLELAKKLKQRHPVKVFHMVNINRISSIEKTLNYLIDNSKGHEDENSISSDDEISVSVKKGVWNVSEAVILAGFARLSAYYPTDVYTRPIGGNDTRSGLKVAREPSRSDDSHHWDEGTAKLNDIFWVSAYIGEDCQNLRKITEILSNKNIKIVRDSSHLGSIVNNTESDEQELKEKIDEYMSAVGKLLDFSRTVDYSDIISDDLKQIYAELEKETPDDFANYELDLYGVKDKLEHVEQQTEEINSLYNRWRSLSSKIKQQLSESMSNLEEQATIDFTKVYHVTSLKNYEKIKIEGLQINKERFFTSVPSIEEMGDWVKSAYGCNPIFLATKPNLYYAENTIELIVDVSNLQIAADLGSLIDKGAELTEKGFFFDYNFKGLGYEFPNVDLQEPYFYEKAIKSTKTLVCLENIDPSRITVNIIAKKKNIKKLEEKDPASYNVKSLIKSIQDYAFKKNLPAPEKKLDRGSDALIFDTDNKEYIIRVEEIEEHEDPKNLRELKFLNNPNIKKTGGVAEIIHWKIISSSSINYLVTWKEKVNTNMENYLYNKYPPDTVNFIVKLINFYAYKANDLENKLHYLNNYPETQPLYNAIQNGLPINDLAFDQNLGINSKGIIVAYDC